MNSAVSLLRLWHLCVRTQGDGEVGVLRWSTLRQALKGLGERAQHLRCNSVDDILRQHFGSDRGDRGHVSFTRYWHGMEAILQACGAFHSGGVDYETEQKVASLRSFRDAVLKELKCTAGGEDDMESGTYHVHDLGVLCRRLRRVASATDPIVAAYWGERFVGLPSTEKTVTGDEIATALLAWLEDLLHQEFPMDDIEAAQLVLDLESEEEDRSASEVEDDEYTWRGTRSTAPSRGSSGGSNIGGGGCSGGGGGNFGGRGSAGRGSGSLQVSSPPTRRPGSGNFSANPGGGGGYPEESAMQGPPRNSHGSAAGHANIAELLMECEAKGPEEEHFRDLLVNNLQEGGGSLFDFYRAVRDTVYDEEGYDSGGNSRRSGASTPPFNRSASGYRLLGPASVRAAVGRLNVIFQHRVRETFRHIQTVTPLSGAGRNNTGGNAAPSVGDAEPGDNQILVALLCSQTQTAKMLERRATLVPFAYHIAWLLHRVRQRFVAEAFRVLEVGDEAGDGSTPLDGGFPPPEPVGSPPTSGRASLSSVSGSVGGSTSRYVTGDHQPEFFPAAQASPPIVIHQSEWQQQTQAAPVQTMAPQASTTVQMLTPPPSYSPPALLPCSTPSAPGPGIALAALPVPSHQVIVPVTAMPQGVHVPVATVVGPPGSARLSVAERSGSMMASVQLSPNMTHRSTLTSSSAHAAAAPSPSPATRRWGGGARSPTSPSPARGGTHSVLMRAAPPSHMPATGAHMVPGNVVVGVESSQSAAAAPQPRRGPPRGLTLRLDSP
eukprot:TRINITY_DN48709_c0_g1_i1.p1 TRINITY_DN48709_c0_g1~~TRINITY_DN48709_c0_g1_i1.p1  ORF type:complete len:776 (-),score=127.42 TRINITY_DN48709_c0_g1_i1:133-2460(-)